MAQTTGTKRSTKQADAIQSDHGTFGRYVETPVDRMSPEMLDAFEFTKKLRGEVPGPHKIWPINPKLSKTIVPTGAYFQTQSTLTKAEIEITENRIDRAPLSPVAKLFARSSANR